MNPTSSMLRASTRDAHAALESSALARSLMSPALSLQTYLDILQRWSQAWNMLEGVLAQSAAHARCTELLPRPRAAMAAQDLAALGQLPGGAAQPGPSPDAAVPAAAANASEWLGMAYVLRGSSLGGRVIARHVRSVLSLEPGVGTTFFEHAEADSPGWSAWLRELDSRVRSQSEQRDCLRAAQSVFAFLQQAFAAPLVRPVAAAETA